LAYKFPETKYSYTTKDVALYALTVGAAKNPIDDKQLSFVYENHQEFRALPTIGVTFPFATMGHVTHIDGLKFNPMMLLHGEQYLEIRKPIPTSGKLTNYGHVSAIHDKGSGAVVILDIVSKDEKGEEITFNQSSLFIRGIGGFGGNRGAPSESNEPPNRPPDAVATDKTSENQAHFYRWAGGDLNPLHVDPSLASMGGFNRPILHGLCTFGHAGRAVVENFADYDTSKFKSIRARFSKHVFPGETIITEMWRVSPTKILFRCKVAERNEIVLSNGAVELHAGAGAATTTSGAAPASNFKAAALFTELEKRVGTDGAELVKQVNGIYQFDITKDGKTETWGVDLKNGNGKLIHGKPEKADCAITVSDDDFIQIFTGKMNAQEAFMAGKLKLKGNIQLAMKLSALFKPNAKL